MKNIINRLSPIFLSYNLIGDYVINKIIWTIAISMILVSSIYYSILLKFPQLKFKKMYKSLKEKDPEGISSKDTLIMSLASKIGVGALAGVAFAINFGGIGTIFWMWVSSFFVSVICYLENFLAIKYKEKDNDYYKGGPAYYIKKGLKNNKLATIYSLVALFTYLIGFSTIQNNTITTLISSSYNINKIVISLIVALISFFLICKGLKTISNVCNKIVPIMSLLYILLGVFVIFINIEKIPTIVLLIVKEGLNMKSATYGILTSLLIGVQKGIFSSEAGVGTSAIISGATSNNNPEKQGYIGIIETYFISLVITTITAFMIILSNNYNLQLSNINGIEITLKSFVYFFKDFGNIFLTIIMLLFSFSTIITVYYYGESNYKFLTKNVNKTIVLKILTSLIIFIGGITKARIIWNLTDILLGVLSIINIYSIIKLNKEIKKKVQYGNNKRMG